MYMEVRHVTFRDLDGDVQLPAPTSMLEEWYIKVRDAAVTDLDIEDLARACRQNLYSTTVIPLCLLKLEEDPLAGEMYDGELMHAMKGVAPDYWFTQPIDRERFLMLARRAFHGSGDASFDITEHDLLPR